MPLTALIVIGAILLSLILLMLIRIKITIEYNETLRIYASILHFIRISITPSKEKKIKLSAYTDKAITKREKAAQEKALRKEQKKQEKKKKKAEKKKRLKEHPEEAKQERTLSENISLITDIVKVLLRRFFRHLRIDLSRIHISVAGSDAAQTAILYGVICQAVAYLLELMGRFRTVSTPDFADVSVTPDWVGEKTTVDVKLSFSLRVWHLFDLIFRVAGRAIKHIFRDMKKKQRASSPNTSKHRVCAPKPTVSKR